MLGLAHCEFGRQGPLEGLWVGVGGAGSRGLLTRGRSHVSTAGLTSWLCGLASPERSCPRAGSQLADCAALPRGRSQGAGRPVEEAAGEWGAQSGPRGLFGGLCCCSAAGLLSRYLWVRSKPGPQPWSCSSPLGHPPQLHPCLSRAAWRLQQTQQDCRQRPLAALPSSLLPFSARGRWSLGL